MRRVSTDVMHINASFSLHFNPGYRIYVVFHLSTRGDTHGRTWTVSMRSTQRRRLEWAADWSSKTSRDLTHAPKQHWRPLTPLTPAPRDHIGADATAMNKKPFHPDLDPAPARARNRNRNRNPTLHSLATPILPVAFCGSRTPPAFSPLLISQLLSVLSSSIPATASPIPPRGIPTNHSQHRSTHCHLVLSVA